MTRLDRERETVHTMIGMYCNDHHHSKDELCPDCEELQLYADLRLNKCRFGETKPVCGRCTVHCYKPDMRNQIKKVMRYSGPMMFFRHPKLAIEHVKDRLMYKPVLPGKKK